MINWETVEGVIAGLTDAAALGQRLRQLQIADSKAADLERLEKKYATADSLRAEAAAMLSRASKMQTELAHREAGLQPREAKLDERERRLAAREEALAVRERQVEARHAHLSEIASRFSVETAA